MYKISSAQLEKRDDRHIKPPQVGEPLSVSEKLVREEIKKLSENREEIKKLKDQVESADKEEA